MKLWEVPIEEVVSRSVTYIVWANSKLEAETKALTGVTAKEIAGDRYNNEIIHRSLDGGAKVQPGQ